jgi:hypothetical protein
VDGDGFLDLAVGSARGPALVFLNTGPSTVDAPAIAGAPGRLRAAPNPFRAATVIEASGRGDVEIFDVQGRLVRRLHPSGERAVWDGTDAAGRRVAAGAYLVRQAVRGEVHTARVVRIR